MRVTQPAVLVGNYDWDESLLPKAEYEARIKDVFAKLEGTGVSGLVVYGNKVDNAAMAYLSNFAPKIESGVVLVTKDGRIRVHGAGNPAMMVNAKRLTWTEDVRPLRDAGKNIADWAAEAASGTLGLWGSEAMPADLLPRIEAALGDKELVDVGARLDPLLRAKSPAALKLMRAASGILGKAASALKQSFENGKTAREAAIAAEQAAADAGAQDVRVLVSMSKAGTPTAIDYPESARLDPVLAYLAVRYAGYWAEGHVTLASSPNQTLTRTEAALKAMLAKAKAGVALAALRDMAQTALAGTPIHPAVKKPAMGIGLQLEEREPEGATLEAGRVYSLRAGAQGGPGDNALLSAMIVPTANGADILWSALG